MRRASLVYVISFAKAGTHLIREVMKAFGYEVHGPMLSEEIVHTLRTNPLTLPANTCILLHELRLEEFDQQLAQHWHATGHPAMILHYRDPRDILCSYVRFLTKDIGSRNFWPGTSHLIHSAILESLPTPEERLDHAIRDESFPNRNTFRDTAWMLKHPMVCKVSFEGLIGARGGGDDALQRKQVASLMKHVGIVGNPAQIAQSIYREDSHTFSKGRIGSWREEFSPEHLRAFNEHFRDILELYGYEVVESLKARGAA